jgi:hypothetical protein
MSFCNVDEKGSISILYMDEQSPVEQVMDVKETYTLYSVPILFFFKNHNTTGAT